MLLRERWEGTSVNCLDRQAEQIVILLFQTMKRKRFKSEPWPSLKHGHVLDLSSDLWLKHEELLVFSPEVRFL